MGSRRGRTVHQVDYHAPPIRMAMAQGTHFECLLYCSCGFTDRGLSRVSPRVARSRAQEAWQSHLADVAPVPWWRRWWQQMWNPAEPGELPAQWAGAAGRAGLLVLTAVMALVAWVLQGGWTPGRGA